MTNFKRISLAAALVISAFGSVSAPAFAGTHPTGDASGPHLHFEIHPFGGPAIDPYPTLQRICG